MKKIIGYIFLVSVAFFTIGCQEDPEPGGTATQEVAGEWWVRVYVDDGDGVIDENDNIIGSYIKVMTFNTSLNTADSLWVYDVGNFWQFQVKAAFDKASKTFSVTEGKNASNDSEVTITDGAVFLGQGKSTSGVKTDSIYFSSSFSDDSPAYGTEYVIAGHRRTGFLEDEH